MDSYKESTLKKYAKSFLLERNEETGGAIYMHSARCRGYCDYACNGSKGFQIASLIDDMEAKCG